MEIKGARLQLSRGQVLVGVIVILLIALVSIPALVKWLQIDMNASVKNQKSTTAFNLASAAVERGYWKVKGSTNTAAMAQSGIPITGYEFDTTYTDLAGGTYRIMISSSGSQGFMITGEGRDNSTKEARAIAAVYKNEAIGGPLLANGNVTWAKGLGLFWGPIMSMGNIQAADNYVAHWGFPRKFAKGVVTGTTVYPRDTNGLLPPNTDNVEWWSDFQGVPELPMLDFAALRSSAAATHTLNVYGWYGSSTHTDPVTGNTVSGGAPWDLHAKPCMNTGNPTTCFDYSSNHPKGTGNDPGDSYTWYYDGDLVLSGSNNGLGVGLQGNLIVRGNLTLDDSGNYQFTGPVPVNAWQDQQKLLAANSSGGGAAYDTAASDEYPADIGYHKTMSTFNFGTQVFNVPGSGSGWTNTVGMHGFTYVGKNLTITNKGFMDFVGAIWVNGNVIAAGASATHFCGVFFDDSLQLPTLNVILVQQSWNEVSPSSQPWL